jgi:hypothetical protein
LRYGQRDRCEARSLCLVLASLPSVHGPLTCGTIFPGKLIKISQYWGKFIGLLTPLASQTRTVRSLDAVYRIPPPPNPPPPQRTTFTLAVCPPSVYSTRRVRVDHTLTVPSFDEDASRGAEGFLTKVYQHGLTRVQKYRAHMWIGSHESDVTHFVWPFKASPIAFPVFGFHRRTYIV